MEFTQKLMQASEVRQASGVSLNEGPEGTLLEAVKLKPGLHLTTQDV